MKYCPKCKTQYDYEMSFCLEDGTALVIADAPTEENIPATMAQIPSLQSAESENGDGEKTFVLPADSLPQTVLQSQNPVSRETVFSTQTPVSQPAIAPNTNPNNQAQTWSNQQKNTAASADLSARSFPVSSAYDSEPPKSKTGILITSLAAGLLLIGLGIGSYLFFQNSQANDIASANRNLNRNSSAPLQSNNNGQNFNAAGETNGVNASQIFPDNSSNIANKSSLTNQPTTKSTPSPTPTTKNTPDSKPSVEPENTPPTPKTPEPKPTPAPRPEAQKTISAGVLNGKATNLVRPPYPPAAKAVRASGTVNVQVTVDEDGNVISASAVSGHPLLRQSAESAARSSKFQPTTLSGQRVKVTGIIVYNFINQ